MGILRMAREKIKENNLISIEEQLVNKDFGVKPKLTLGKKIGYMLNKKRGIWVLRLGKTKTWHLEFRRMSKDGMFIDGDYILEEQNMFINHKFGSLVVYYDQNPQPLNFKWTPAKIGSGDIIVTSDSLKKFMLQKIWGDFVGKPFEFNLLMILIIGAVVIIGGFIVMRFIV